MGTGTEPTLFRGLLLHDQRIDIGSVWASQSTYDTAGSVAGIPEPSADTEMVLEASGTQTDSTAIEVLSISGGFAEPGGGGFAWRYEGDALYRGRDVPNVITGFEFVSWTTTSDAHITPHAVTLADDTVVAVTDDTSVSREVNAWIRATDGAWTDVGAIHTETNTDVLSPCLVLLPSGRILCFHFVHTSTRTQIAMRYSEDAGVTWQQGSAYVLPDPILRSTYTIKRFRAAYKDGQILMLLHLQSATPRDVFFQYASDNLGASFDLVTSFDGSTIGERYGYPDIAVVGGKFVAAALAFDGANAGGCNVWLLTSAYEPVLAADAITDLSPTEAFTESTSGTSIDVADLAVCADQDGTVYIFTRYSTVATSNGGGICYRSENGGTSWESMGSGNPAGTSDNLGMWWYNEDASDQIVNFSVTPQRGRIVMVHNFTGTPDLHDDSFCVTYIGGYTQITMPSLDNYVRDIGQVNFTHNYLPFDLPGDIDWTKTAVGTTSESLTGGALVIGCTSLGGTLYYDRNVPGTIAEGVIAKFAAESGTAFRFFVQLADGVSDYMVEVRVTGTDLLLRDEHAGTTINTVAYDGSAVEVIVAVANDDVVAAWRYLNTSEDRQFVELGSSGVLADAGAGPINNNISFGVDGSTGEATVYQVHDASDEYTGLQLAGGFTNPDDLYARTFGTNAVSITDGLKIRATDGPTFEGDEWTISSRSDYALTNTLPNVQPSPRKPWRSATTTADMMIAFDLNDESATPANSWLGDGWIAVYLQGINFRDFVIQTSDNTPTWGDVASVDASVAVSYQRFGNTLQPDTAATSGIYLQRNELSGGWFEFQGGQLRKITGNTEGAWVNSGVSSGVPAGKYPTIFLDGVTGAEGTGTASGRIWFPSVCAVIPVPFSEAIRQGIRLKLRPSGTSQAPADGYYEIGQCVIGTVAAFGWDYEESRGRTYTPNVEVTTLRDGSRFSRVLGPGRKRVEFSWPNGVPQRRISGSSTSDDFLEQGDGVPFAAKHDIPEMLQGIFEELDGSHTPVVYLPYIDGTSENTLTYQRVRGAVYGRIVSTLQIDTVNGDEGIDEFLRVGNIVIEEEL